MNYADFGMGTWHPKTGMFDVVRAMESLENWELLFIPTPLKK
jgi:hypothetical protein